MAFLDANGVTRLVTDLNSIYEYKMSAGNGIAINASNAISLTTAVQDKLSHIYVQTPTAAGSDTAPETYWSFGKADTSTGYTFSYWNGFNNGTFGNYFGFGTTNSTIASGGLRLYVGSTLMALRDYTSNTAGSYYWRFNPQDITPYQGETVTLPSSGNYLYGIGYFGAGTSPTMYVEILLPKKIAAGKTSVAFKPGFGLSGTPHAFSNFARTSSLSTFW